jgi:hypothetical protein
LLRIGLRQPRDCLEKIFKLSQIERYSEKEAESLATGVWGRGLFFLKVSPGPDIS